MALDSDLKRAKALLPPSLKSLGPTLGKLLSSDEYTRTEGFDAIDDKLRGKKLGVREALALVRIATEVTFPPQQFDWNDTAHDFLFPLVENPHPKLVAPLRAAYPRVPDRAKCAVLAALGAIATRPAAEAFIACIREHGWPKGVYGRVFTELYKLEKFADVLFPELVTLAGDELGDVTDVLISALTSGALEPRKVNLEPLAPIAIDALRRALTKVRSKQKSGIAWRFSESYYALRTTTGAWLDVAGHLKAPALLPLLEKATKLRDPKLVAFAALSLVRRKRPVPAAVFELVAADHETRNLLYDYLANLEALAKFPARWRTWEAFAAAEMVKWLMYPSELGHAPEQLELMKKLTSGKQTLYVWKFRVGKTWKAGVSGPYVLKGKPKPVWGASTFSRFEPAKSKTAEEHALAVLETLASWSKAHAADKKAKAKKT